MKKLTALSLNILILLISLTCSTSLGVTFAQETNSFWASEKTIFEKEDGADLAGIFS